MRVKDVVILKEVADDLNDGKAFYGQREFGVGDYFWDSLFGEAMIIVSATWEFYVCWKIGNNK